MEGMKQASKQLVFVCFFVVEKVENLDMKKGVDLTE
jgi:hypothetical protein